MIAFSFCERMCARVCVRVCVRAHVYMHVCACILHVRMHAHLPVFDASRFGAGFTFFSIFLSFFLLTFAQYYESLKHVLK